LQSGIGLSDGRELSCPNRFARIAPDIHCCSRVAFQGRIATDSHSLSAKNIQQ
jgi:hypothetical protein